MTTGRKGKKRAPVLKGRETLPPIIIQCTGLLTFLFFCGFWAITNRMAPELLAASGTLVGTGLVAEARQKLRVTIEEDDEA